MIQQELRVKCAIFAKFGGKNANLPKFYWDILMELNLTTICIYLYILFTNNVELVSRFFKQTMKDVPGRDIHKGPTKVYLLGGTHTGSVVVPSPLVNPYLEGYIRGWQYFLDYLSTGRQADFADPNTILWRCAETSLCGFSGSALPVVSKGDEVPKAAVLVLGFQSYEFPGRIRLEAGVPDH